MHSFSCKNLGFYLFGQYDLNKIDEMGAVFARKIKLKSYLMKVLIKR